MNRLAKTPMYRRSFYRPVSVGAQAGPPSAMMLAAVASIAQYAAALVPYALELPKWDEYKLTRARQRLSDVVWFTAHGQGQRKPNPAKTGYQAMMNLEQVFQDATWLLQNVKPSEQYPEWVEDYVNQAHVDMGDIYMAHVRMGGRPKIPMQLLDGRAPNPSHEHARRDVLAR